jgi:hypothetical protein
MEFVRRKCLSNNCPAMACPSQTGYCSYHDLQRTPYGKRPSKEEALREVNRRFAEMENFILLETPPITQVVQ